MNKKNRRLLFRSFDTTLNEAQQKKLDQALRNDPVLVDERNLVTALRQDIQASGYGPFRPGFGERVSARILSIDPRVSASPDLFYETLTLAFRKLAWAGGLAILVLSLLHLLGSSVLTPDTLWQLTDDSVAELISLGLF